MDNLYRITSLEGLLSLLINKTERFVRPIDCWEDTFEGYMLHLLDTNEGMLKVINRLHFEVSDKVADVTIRNFSKLQRSRYACYGLCWSIIRDSDAMWRIYSYDKKGIQLISTKERISSMLVAAGWDKKDFDIYEVKYDIENEEEAISKILQRNSKVDSAYFHKRPAFEHEKEVRVLLNDAKTYKNIEAFSSEAIRLNLKFTDEKKSVPERIQEAIIRFGAKDNYRNVAPVSLSIPINDLNNYIVGIRVHPQAADWYADLIKKLCLEYGLKYEGKSELYRIV